MGAGLLWAPLASQLMVAVHVQGESLGPDPAWLKPVTSRAWQLLFNPSQSNISDY